MVIVSSKQHCDVSLLLQRIGRTGRQNGCPGLVIIGGDVETEEDARKCLQLHDERIVVVKTKAMQLHSELREMQNEKHLKTHPNNAVQDQSIKAKRDEGLQETTIFDEMSTRGLSSPKINVVRATSSGGIMRPRTNWTEDGADGEDGPPDYDVPLVRLDAMRALELACPGSHCRTSFGGLVHCLNPCFKGRLPGPNELDWLPDVDCIPAFMLTHMDDKHYFHSKATWDRIPSLDAGAHDDQLTSMSVYMVWRFTSFMSIYNSNDRITEQPPRGNESAGYHFYARPLPASLGVDGLERASAGAATRVWLSMRRHVPPARECDRRSHRASHRGSIERETWAASWAFARACPRRQAVRVRAGRHRCGQVRVGPDARARR